MLNWALEGFGHWAGYEKTSPRQTWFNKGFDKNLRPVEYDWKKETASLDERGPDGDEPATGNDQVKVYPVRTALSRQLTRADCVVDIRAAVIAKGDGLTPEIRDSIRRFVSRLKLPRKETVLFRIDRNRSGEKAYEFFINQQNKLATWLGFKYCIIQG